MRVHHLLRTAAFLFVLFTSSWVFASAPTATTSAATSLTTSSAVLNGAGSPDGQDATGWFRYDTTNPGTCSDAFGTRVPAVGGTDLGTGAASVPYSITATGLSSGVVYFYCAIVSNSSGTAFGTVLSFTVPGQPQVVTSAATGVTNSQATLNGSANPVASPSTGWFRYATTSPGTCNDTFGTRAPAAGGTALGAGNGPVGYSQAISGLSPVTTYYYCAIAANAEGTSFGVVLTFTTLSGSPVTTTNAATLVTSNTAQLNGSSNPEASPSTGWFRYATTSPGTCNDTFGTRAPAAGGTALGSGNAPVLYSQAISGLSSQTTYYYCTIASNVDGTSFGAVLSFTTAATTSGNGGACTLPSDCTSGFCANNVCCNTSCSGLCQACSAAAKGSGSDGVCGAAANGTPTVQCAMQAASTCGQTGTCNGAGACSLYPTGTVCGAPLCQGTIREMQSCDGAGNCGPQPGGTDCTPYACANSACDATCATSNDCGPGYVCSMGACVAPFANGIACASGAVCTSGLCVDGVCCDTACVGLCQACSVAKKGQGASGTCGPILAGTNPDNECTISAQSACGQNGECDGTGACQLWAQGISCGASSCQGTVVAGHVCDGAGTCAVPPGGQDCTPYACENGACANPCATNADCVSGDFCSAGVCNPLGTQGSSCSTATQCTSGFCVDAVCCDSACAGSCQACSAIAKGQGMDGTCGPLVAGSSCGAGSCVGKMATAQSECDGTGNCAAGTTQPCAVGYACSGDAGACAISCTDSSACATGYQCTGGMCELLDAGSGDAGSDAGSGGSGSGSGGSGTSGSGSGGSGGGGSGSGSGGSGSGGSGSGRSGSGGSGSGGSGTGGSGSGGSDAGSDAATDGGGSSSPGSNPGCGCRAAGGDAPSNSGVAMVLAGLALIAARRRRTAPAAERRG